MIVALALGFGCAFVGSIPIAGPASVLVFERTLAGHARAAFGVAVGTAVGEAGYALVAFLGMTAALSEFHWLLPVSRIVGAAILIGLGLYFALGRRHRKQDSPVTQRRGRDGLWLGLVVTVVNPTLVVTWSAVVTVLHSTGFLRVEPLDAFPFAVGVAAGVVGWFAVLIALVRKLRDRLHQSTLDTIVRVLGWVLVVAGAGLVVKLAIAGLK